MRIDQAVLDRSGRAMIERGTFLDDFQIEYLHQKGIGGIYVSEGEQDEDEPETSLPKYTREVIEKERVEDRAKVQISESVKKRVGEGIQFLYSNTESENFAEASENIAQDLSKTILTNDAIAVDINTLRVSDEYTFKHSVDVATMSMIIAKQTGLEKKDIYEIGIAGLLHDMGKSRIPNDILNKPAKLTEDEFAMMKQHSLFGFQILKNKDHFSGDILRGVLQHHEKMNGRGYPLGVDSGQIHKYAKIISVADVYDALVTERSYKKGFPRGEAIEMLMAMTEELDIGMLKNFLATIILYPVDSYVNLSNGERARVVANNPENCMRPKVVGVKTGKVYDLANDIQCARLVIL